ncbi:MAG: lactonase family protein [Janthinobacterium lividum]
MRKLLMLAALTPVAAAAAPNQLLLGIDEKTYFEAAQVRNGPAGHDLLAVLDVSDPAHPKVTGQIPLINSVFGPPTNLQITPDGKLGLVANSVVTTEKDGKFAATPDDTLHVLDLTTQSPRLVETIKVGRQPSGLSISHDGTLALVANRAGRSVSVLHIDGTTVRQVGEVPTGEQAAAVVVTPDGKRAFVAENLAGVVGVLSINDGSVTYDKANDIPVGAGVYNVDVTPDGRTVIAAGTSTDGNGSATTLAVIDATGPHPHAVSFVTVGQGPEGLAISPDGKWVATPLLNGSSAFHAAPGYHPDGVLQVFALQDRTLTPLGEARLGAIPEGIAWSPDSQWLYVGNYADRTLQIFHMDGGKPVDAGTMLLPGQPASIRGMAP